MHLSIVIPSFNRSQSLGRVLAGLRKQRAVDWSRLEVVVVNNNSTDDTSGVAEGFAALLPLKVVFEKRQGPAYARNAGVCNSSGETILFADDDLRFADDWLSAYLEACSEFPDAGYFGGRILADWISPRPAWLQDPNLALLNGVLGCYDLGTVTREMTVEDPLPFGASFAIRRASISSGGEAIFREDLGRCGTNLGRGEDTQLLHRLRQQGYRGVYVGGALCWHAVQPSRLTLRALWDYGVASGMAHQAIFPDPNNEGSLAAITEYLARGCVQLLNGRGDRFRQCVINAGIQVGLMQANRRS